MTLGAIVTAQSIGAALSNLTARYIVDAWGYPMGFLSLAGGRDGAHPLLLGHA